jgi:hypothetical protein
MTAPRRLGVVVGRLDALDVGEGPQCRPGLEQVAGQPTGALVRGRLASVALEEGPQLALERGDLDEESRAVAVSLEVIPGGEEAPGDLESGPTEALLRFGPFALGGEVAEEVRPADLAGGGLEVAVRPPAIGADDAGEVWAE